MAPVHAVGMDARQRTEENSIRAPYLSHMGPNRSRTIIVPPTLAMEEVQISFFVKPNVIWISPRSGVMANQMKNAMKKAHHEQ